MKRNISVVIGCLILMSCTSEESLESGSTDVPVIDTTTAESPLAGELGQVSPDGPSEASASDESDGSSIDASEPTSDAEMSTGDGDIVADKSATGGEDDTTTSTSATTATADTNDGGSLSTTTLAPEETSTTESVPVATTGTVERRGDANRSTDDDAIDASVAEIVSVTGIPYDDQLRQCLIGRGIDIDRHVSEEARIISILQEVLGCDPERAAQAEAQAVVLPEGVSRKDFECVATELNSYFAGLSTEAAIEFFFDDAASRNGTLREKAGPSAQTICNLTESQVIEIIGDQWLT